MHRDEAQNGPLDDITPEQINRAIQAAVLDPDIPDDVEELTRQLDEVLEQMVAEGEAEVCTIEGERRYRLTEQGEAMAAELVRSLVGPQ